MVARLWFLALAAVAATALGCGGGGGGTGQPGSDAVDPDAAGSEGIPAGDEAPQPDTAQDADRDGVEDPGQGDTGALDLPGDPAPADPGSDPVSKDTSHPADPGDEPEDLPVQEQGPLPDFGFPGGCSSNAECQGDMICCDFFGSGMKMCLPESLCGGASCDKDADCKPGQVCCKFGEMAADPMCMATDMCPKECTTNDDCPAGRECCDLSSDSEKTVICIDKGQCPEKCVHATSECPLGQECCDAGDGLLVCVSASECPGSVPCTQGEVCKNSKGEPNGFECCDVPELGWRCVGSGGCGDWGTCAGDEDCPKGRECCALEAGPTCVPTGACPDQGSQPHACIGACSDPPDEAHG